MKLAFSFPPTNHFAYGGVHSSTCVHGWNHDNSRAATRWAGGDEQKMRAALFLLLTLRGTPFLYQGDELGLPDAEIPPDRVVDVDGRDPERAPIPWRPPSEDGAGAGFTTGRPWLPITPAAEELNAERQAHDPDSTLALARRLADLRMAEPTLQSGEIGRASCRERV